MELPKNKVDFKFLKIDSDNIVWETLPSKENHFVYLNQHKLAHITVKEGDNTILLKSDMKISGSKPEVPIQQINPNAKADLLDKFVKKVSPTGNEDLIIATIELPIKLTKSSN